MQNKTDNTNTPLLGSDSFNGDDTFEYNDTTQVSLRENNQEMNACVLPKAAMDDTRHCTLSDLYRSCTEIPLLSSTGKSHCCLIGDLTVDSKLVFPWMTESVKRVGGGYQLVGCSWLSGK